MSHSLEVGTRVIKRDGRVCVIADTRSRTFAGIQCVKRREEREVERGKKKNKKKKNGIGLLEVVLI